MPDNTQNTSAQQPSQDDASRFGAVLNGNNNPTQSPQNTGGTDDASRFAAIANQQPQPIPPAQPNSNSAWDVAKGAFRTLSDLNDSVNTGITEGVGDTVHGVGELIRKGGNLVHAGLGDKIVPPAGQQAFDKMDTAQNPAEMAGKVAESIAELALGDEAIKGLSLGEKLTHVGKLADMYEKSGPLARKAIETGLNMVRTGTVAGTQTGVKTGSVKDAAIAAGTGAAAVPVVEGAGAVLSKLGSKAPVTSILEQAPEIEDAGNAAKEAATRVRDEAGKAVSAAKAAAVPEGFTLTVGNDGSKLADTLSKISDEIGAESGGLESLRDPHLDIVRNVTDELSGKQSLTAPEYESVKSQLNSQIARADAAAKSGNATGDVGRYLKQIKSALDSDYYEQLATATNPESAGALQQASKEYAGISKSQTKGPAKSIFKAATPEQTIARLSNADATTVQSFTQGMSESELQPIRDGVFRRFLERSSENGQPNFAKVLNRFDQNSDAMRSLFGDHFDEYRDALKSAANAQRTGKAVKSVLQKGALTAGAGVGGYAAYKIMREVLR